MEIHPQANLTYAVKVTLKDFQILKTLGTGAYGIVYLVRKLTGVDKGELYAMKVLEKSKIVGSKKTIEHTLTEREVLEAVRSSKFLITMHYAFQTTEKLHLVIDYASGGELFTHLEVRGFFTEDATRIYVAEIVLAIQKLHKLGVIYRDLKLENVLLDSDGHIILTDFGLSKKFDLTERTNRSKRFREKRTYSHCGTPGYMAPEIINRGFQGHGFSVDWWALGILTFELITGEIPFSSEDHKNSREMARQILYSEPELDPKLMSEDCQDFIKKLLVKNPKRRLGGGISGAEELKRHRFLKHLDWTALERKQIPPPFLPIINHELDLGNFSTNFTDLIPNYETENSEVSKQGQTIFERYSFGPPKPEINSETEIAAEALLSLRNSISPFYQVYHVDFEEAMLGDGSFTVCHRCVHRKTQQEFAVKIVSKHYNCENEIRILGICKGGPNIVELYEVYEDEDNKYLVFELLRGGELFDRLRQGKLPEEEARLIMGNLASALFSIHSRKVVHRDLKPENILFVDQDSSQVKIVDFGFAKFNPESHGMRTPCYTVPYAAPEVVAVEIGSKPFYDERCDLWSLGLILYSMLSGDILSETLDYLDGPESLFNEIQNGLFNLSGPKWDNISFEAKRITSGLLSIDPAKRLRLTDLLESKWIQNNKFQETIKQSHSFYLEEPYLTKMCIPKLLHRRNLNNNSSAGSSKHSNQSSLASNFDALDITQSDQKSPLDLTKNKRFTNRSVNPKHIHARRRLSMNFSQQNVNISPPKSELDQRFDLVEARLKELWSDTESSTDNAKALIIQTTSTFLAQTDQNNLSPDLVSSFIDEEELQELWNKTDNSHKLSIPIYDSNVVAKTLGLPIPHITGDSDILDAELIKKRKLKEVVDPEYLQVCKSPRTKHNLKQASSHSSNDSQSCKKNGKKLAKPPANEFKEREFVVTRSGRKVFKRDPSDYLGNSSLKKQFQTQCSKT